MPSYEHNSTDIEKAELLTSKDTVHRFAAIIIYKIISHLENTTKNKNERESHRVTRCHTCRVSRRIKLSRGVDDAVSRVSRDLCHEE
ncbi:hypothetical protein T06_16152 [Trichinella sp. T6]|nr:hypothetical protein T06_16152 [Trichinella sp. T6]